MCCQNGVYWLGALRRRKVLVELSRPLTIVAGVLRQTLVWAARDRTVRRAVRHFGEMGVEAERSWLGKDWGHALII